MKEQFLQIKNLLKDKTNVLILTHQKIDGDGLSAMLALRQLLSYQGKNVIAFSKEEIADIYHFLPNVAEIESVLRSSKDFIISIKCDNIDEIDKLKYSIDNNILNIIITPKDGELTAESITTKKGVGQYDLIFVLDTGDLEHLGSFYEENTEMFFSTPVINIDHHITNTGFGQINLVDITAASTTEIIYQLILELADKPKQFIDEDMATLLLTGLIVDTGSFQHTNTSPKALELAADLIELGARQQEIIQNIYKTKKLSTLKLWGRILAKIEEDPIHRIVWSTITKSDLYETGASPEDAEGLIDELMTNAPGAEIVVLMKDSFQNIMSTSLRSTSIAIDTLPIAQNFGGGGHKQASGFKKSGQNFNAFVADTIDYIEKFQEKRLNLIPEDIDYMKQKQQEQKKILEEINLQKMKNDMNNNENKETRDILSELTKPLDNKGKVEIRKVNLENETEINNIKENKLEETEENKTIEIKQEVKAEIKPELNSEVIYKAQNINNSVLDEKLDEKKIENNQNKLLNNVTVANITPSKNNLKKEIPSEEMATYPDKYESPRQRAKFVDNAEMLDTKNLNNETKTDQINQSNQSSPNPNNSNNAKSNNPNNQVNQNNQSNQNKPKPNNQNNPNNSVVQNQNKPKTNPNNQNATNNQATSNLNNPNNQNATNNQATSNLNNSNNQNATNNQSNQIIQNKPKPNNQNNPVVPNQNNQTSQPKQNNQAKSTQNQPVQSQPQPTQANQATQNIQVQTSQKQTVPVQAQVPQNQTTLPQAQVSQTQTTPAQAQVSQTQATQTSPTETQPQFTKEQATQYAQYYWQQLQQMNPQSQEYAQVYQWYNYYLQWMQYLQ